MKNTIISVVLFIFSFLVVMVNGQAQVSESCDCTVDTLGYANFIPTLDVDEEAVFQFHVSGTFAVAYGVIDGTTPTVVQNLIDNHPQVTTIVMYACPGSDNDVANLQAAKLIYEKGYKMYLPVNGWVASGATDMFLAGSTRVVEVTPDAVGVHSWSDGVNEATDFPHGHEFHQPYINYYMSVGFSQEEAEDFYYFTIDAAPASNVHWMTQDEMDQYKVRTCKYAQNPNYSITTTQMGLVADLGGADYQWIDCSDNSAIAGETNQFFLPSENGEFAVQITESNCMNTSSCYAFTTTSIIESSFENKLLVSPNPSQGEYTIDLGRDYTFVELTLIDVNGKLIKSMVHHNGRMVPLVIDGPSGIYFLRLTAEQHSATLQLIKE